MNYREKFSEFLSEDFWQESYSIFLCPNGIKETQEKEFLAKVNSRPSIQKQAKNIITRYDLKHSLDSISSSFEKKIKELKYEESESKDLLIQYTNELISDMQSHFEKRKLFFDTIVDYL